LLDLEINQDKFNRGYDEPVTVAGKRVPHNILVPGSSTLERWEEVARTESSDII
jgi:hypothetical protein